MSKIKLIHILYLLLPLLLFSACKAGHKYIRPVAKDMPPVFYDLKEGTVADMGWSTLYQDSVLQNLIEEALEHNKDMLIATARIKEMVANKRISFAGLFPEIGLEAAGQREFLNYGGNTEKYTPEVRANLGISWELDIWGKLRWENEAGIAAYLQSVEAKRALQLTIISQVAQNYFELRTLDKELEIIHQTLEARQEGVNFAKLRYEGGLTSEIPYRQSLVELARTETLIPNLEKQIMLKENDLFVLTGRFPSEIMERGESIKKQQVPATLPIDLPSEVLKRRPDVIQAEQKLIEANAKAGVAYTQIFPSLKLTGRLGGENSELTDFLKSPTWFIAGSLAGPLFNMGKNKATHKAAQAVYEQELHSYEKTILEVFKEVNNSIINYKKNKEARKSCEALYNSARSYQVLAMLQYVNGLVSYLDVLDAQRQLFDAEIALNEANLNELIATVLLYKALGGGLEK